MTCSWYAHLTQHMYCLWLPMRWNAPTIQATLELSASFVPPRAYLYKVPKLVDSRIRSQAGMMVIYPRL